MPLLKASRVSFLGFMFRNEAWDITSDTMTDLLASVTAGSLYISLHTSRPPTTQTEYEVAYTGYSRPAIARSRTEWIINSFASDPYATATNQIRFPLHQGGGQVNVVCFGIGTHPTDAGTLLYVSDLGFLGGIFQGPNGSAIINEGQVPYIPGNSLRVTMRGI